MTRNLISLAVLLPFSVFCQSRNVPAFGKVDVADLKQTACSYDKDAQAEEIFNVGDFSLDVIGGQAYQTVHRHVRIKIYSEKGLEYADVKLPYANYRNDEVISNLVANTYNLDATGNVVATKLEKDLVYDRKIDIAHAQKIFTMPNVKVGSVIEYKYTINKAYLINWYLQRQIPTRYTSFIVDVPSLFEMYLRPMCNMPYESKDKSTSQRTIKTFAMANVPALYQEDYMTCYDDYRQRIETWPIAMTVDGIRYPLLKSWTETTKHALTDESFGTQLKKSIPRTSDLDLALQPVTDSFQRMSIIYNYVRKNMAWDGQQTIYASTGVKSAWKEKKGTSGEINLILINLLKDAGLRAYPVMVSTHDNGTVSTAFPDFSQFNNVMAIVKIRNKEYVLDGTDKYTPASLIPEGVMNTEGLVIDESNMNNYYWTMLWDPNKLLNDVVAIQAVVKETGDMEGHASVRSQDYSRIDRAKMYLHAKDQYVSKYCVSAKDGIKLDNMEIEGVNQDTVPLVQKFDFHAPVNHSGDYSYFSANFFTGMEKNPFIADNRFSDIFFGTNQSHTIVANIQIPEGYEFDALPKNTRITMEDKSLVVTRMVEAQNGVLSTRITLEYKRPFYTIEEYPVLKEFYKKMYSLLDEQFVIKKKA